VYQIVTAFSLNKVLDNTDCDSSIN